MIYRIAIIWVAMMLFPMLGSAEIYKYRDKNGVLRFTDNLTEVPLDQRRNIQQYQEIKTDPATTEQTSAEEDTGPDPKALETELLSEKEVLDEEYSRLTSVREALESTEQPSTDEEIAAHNKKVQDYNNQLKLYESKQKAFREKLQAYQEASEQ